MEEEHKELMRPLLTSVSTLFSSGAVSRRLTPQQHLNYLRNRSRDEAASFSPEKCLLLDKAPWKGNSLKPLIGTENLSSRLGTTLGHTLLLFLGTTLVPGSEVTMRDAVFTQEQNFAEPLYKT